MRTVTRTERGWPGHFIGAMSCSFRRNTLLECGDTRIVVSTVGCYRPAHKGEKAEPEEIGYHRFYETMAFSAKQDGIYWDADVHAGELGFESERAVTKMTAESDQQANDMHEVVVAEFTEKLAGGWTPDQEASDD